MLNDPWTQRFRFSLPVSTLLLLGLIGLAETGLAGTWNGQLVSSWINRAPAIDGQIQAAEWAEAISIDLGQGVTARIGNDARTLYLAVLDPRPTTVDHALDRLVLFFDDESGTVPRLDDNWWGVECHALPAVGDGEISFTFTGEVDYVEWYSVHLGTFPCPPQPVGDRLRAAVEPQGVGASYEIALPLDGPAPLHAAPGQRFGFLLQLFAPYSGVSPLCYLSSCGTGPFSYQNLVLASGGCNTGPQDFGSGDPQLGLPLDWTSEVSFGSGQGWVQSLPPSYGDPVFCQSNDTGGAGGAACVANVFSTSANTVSLLRMPLTLAGQTSATVRSRAVLVVDPNGSGANDLLRSDVLRQDATTENAFFWQGQDQSATVVLPLTLGGSPPVELWFIHSTFAAGGVEGGYAQLDDVELFCGPVLFADGFESGLTTHWSATAP